MLYILARMIFDVVLFAGALGLFLYLTYPV